MVAPASSETTTHMQRRVAVMRTRLVEIAENLLSEGGTPAAHQRY